MSREILPPHERVRWAISTSGKTLESIAETIGCSHVTLSHWQTGKTPLEKIQVGLLLHFAEVSNTELRWLLYGEEPRRPAQSEGQALHRMHQALRVMEELAPWKIEPIVTMVEAAAGVKPEPGNEPESAG